MATPPDKITGANAVEPRQLDEFGRWCGIGVICAVSALSFFTACVSSSRTVSTRTGLLYQTIIAGSGPAALPGQSVRIHETTTLADGTTIYSTRTKNQPLTFLLGGNQVIAGLDEGVTGMRVGERRKLIIPPTLSKRSVYPADTPPNATLYYDIELVEILPHNQ